MSSSLGDLRVVDFSRVLAGPFATMLLADLGATVTKIERPGTGDDTRGWGPPFDESGQATYFQSVNRNKESITLDLTGEADLERARALAREADVVVENFRPGLMERLGLGYDDLRADNPGLVYCSITGFGRDRGAELPGYDLLIQALGGLMSITGSPDGEPQKVGVAVVDVFAGLFATVGMLAAVRHRDATGEGQRVEINLLSSLLAALVNQGTGYTAGGVVPARMGNAHPSVAPYEVLPCGEGDLVLAVGNDRQFGVLCERLGAAGLAEDPRYATNTARVENRETLRAELVRLLAERPAADWAKELSAARVPAGVVNDLAGAFRLAADLGLDPIVSIPRDDGTAARLTRNPIGLSATPPAYRSAPPPLS
ncbi:CaiB/BaiF CoA transferase family protein [Prauserella endophytica]|uniref:CoA transferase n=1 Tax=Prauserella endophytica TaxID=1592324 RepID=A0ABY2S8H6_9PSEU|nr:CoA transferase [Prauserella endophytica]PXY30394.1 carnitine dehydratase [Prauserella coralliicola]TKG72219.1 CoA transferase [Prauserella endophytica]